MRYLPWFLESGSKKSVYLRRDEEWSKGLKLRPLPNNPWWRITAVLLTFYDEDESLIECKDTL